MKTTVKIFGIIALAALGVFFTACYENFGIDVRSEPFVPEFIPVEEIVGIPTAVFPFIEIVLSGKVMPENATNKRITWSIKEDGGTGATLERNRLYSKTEEDRTVTLTAAIKNGSGENIDYTQDFNILFSISLAPVASITGIPSTIEVGGYELNGIVRPANASNKEIDWSVKDAGTTHAAIHGNILTTTATGTAVITATIPYGRLDSDYTQDFTIIIVPAIKHVYAVGTYDDNGKNKACYWKDGTFFDLHPAGASYSSAIGIVVANGITYISGNYYNENDDSTACYWRNGVKVDLPKTNTNAITEAIAVDGTTVYITGYITDIHDEWQSCYWKVDGNSAPQRTIITSNDIKETNAAGDYLQPFGCFAVNNGNVYIPLYYSWTVNGNWDDSQYKNYLYENGNFIPFDLSYSFNDIIVLNGTVYMAGNVEINDDYKPFYWSVGAGSYKILEDTNNGSVYSIVVQDGALWFYGADWDSNQSCYWNASGARTVLPENGDEYYDCEVVAYSDGDVYIGWGDGDTQTGYMVLDVDGSFTQLFGAGGTTAVEVKGLAVH